MNYQLNHIALCVKCPEESARFYQNLLNMLGLKAELRGIGDNIIVLGQQGTAIGLKKSEQSGSTAGMDHFGFTTNNINDLETLAEQLDSRNIPYERKKHRDNSISIFLQDPDKYKLQIVYMPQDMYLG